MRGFIRFCAGLFVIAGALVVLLSIAAAVLILGAGRSIPGAAGLTSVLVIAGGLASGASIVLVGGGTYLLASIDQRLEVANRSGAPAGRTVTADLAA